MISKIISTGVVMVSLAVQSGSTMHYVSEPDPEVPKQIVYAEVSAYTSSIDETDDTPHITASGTKTRDGIVACPRKYKFGTVVEILGKKYVCEDRMNARYVNNFDIWMESKKEALEFGRKQLTIEIKNTQKNESK